MKTNKTNQPCPEDTASASSRQLSVLAQQLTRREFGEAAAAIERLFASPGLQDQGCAQSLGQLRQLYIDCQAKLARQHHPAGAHAASELLKETEKQTGYPIRVTFGHGWGMQMAWAEGLDHHLVECPSKSDELEPYYLASALLRIQTETEAFRAGKSRFPTVSEQQIDDLLSFFDPQEAQRLVDEQGLWITLNPHPDDIALGPVRLLMASAPWMVVEARLRQRFPVLRPAQFLARSAALPRVDYEGLPPNQMLVITALDGLNGLFLDQLFGGVTDFAARYRDLDGFDLAQKLWQQWQSRFSAMQPGDEFSLLDDFAEILGLSGRFDWVNVPQNPSNTSVLMGSNNQDTLGSR